MSVDAARIATPSATSRRQSIYRPHRRPAATLWRKVNVVADSTARLTTPAPGCAMLEEAIFYQRNQYGGAVTGGAVGIAEA